MKSLNDNVTLGSFIFRWRGVIPLLLIPIFLFSSNQSARIEIALGEDNYDNWTFLCMAFSFLGILFRSVVVGYAAPGTSGRNRHGQFADSLNTTGLYSIMRHPLYLGNFICIFGLLAASMVWWVILVGALAFWIMTIQIVNVEETFLKSKFGIEYNQWASVTPAFIPKFHNWQKPSQKFNWREVLSREYNGIMALGAAFLVREAFEDLYGERMNFIKWMIEDKSWIILFFVCLVILLTLRTVRKKTNLLSQN